MSNMRKIIWILSLFLIGLTVSSCKTVVKRELSGMFYGTIPANQSMGGYLYLTLHAGGTCALTSYYYDSDGTSPTLHGQWSSSSDKEALLTFGSDTIPFKPVSDTILEMTYEGVSLQLKKEEPLKSDQFLGRYQIPTGDIEGGISRYVEISREANGNPLVTISSTDTKDSLLFRASGKIVNNQIEIPLREVKPEMKSTLVIRFADENNDVIDVFTSIFEDRYDLQYFCRGGASLAGEYSRCK